MSETILISYPHSGQHLFRGVTEAWTGRPDITTEGTPRSVLRQCDAGFRSDPYAPPTLRVGHGAAPLSEFNDGRMLIWLRRNPIEAMMSWWCGSDALPHDVALKAVDAVWPRTLRQDCRQRWAPIPELYESWRGDKATIDYKDLVQNPVAVIRGLSESGFLPEPGRTCAKLLRSPERVIMAILELKMETKLGSQTGGVDFTYWRDRLSEQALTRFRDNLSVV